MTTTYDALLLEAEQARLARNEIADKFDDPEEMLRQRAFNYDADAYLAVQEAHAEQQRIANLIAIGNSDDVTSVVRHNALALALTGLGL
jgi:hypothetical protein